MLRNEFLSVNTSFESTTCMFREMKKKCGGKLNLCVESILKFSLSALFFGSMEMGEGIEMGLLDESIFRYNL